MEFVVWALVSVFHHDEATATGIMLHVHKTGIGIAASTRATSPRRAPLGSRPSRAAHEFPLRCTSRRKSAADPGLEASLALAIRTRARGGTSSSASSTCWHALLDDERVAALVRACGGDVERLRLDPRRVLDSTWSRLRAGTDAPPQQTSASSASSSAPPRHVQSAGARGARRARRPGRHLREPSRTPPTSSPSRASRAST